MFRTLPVSLQSLARTNLAIVVLLLGSMYAPVAWAGNPTPEFTSDDHTTFIANQFNSFEVTTDGNPTPSVSLSGSLPSGVNFVDNGNGTATISGSPALGAPGDYSSTLQACNSQSLVKGGETCVNQSFTLTVEEAPAITSDDHVTFTVGQFNSFLVTTTGSPAPTLEWQYVLPSGVNFVDNGDGTATLSGTPDVGTFGIYNETIEASNDVDIADQSFTFTILEAPSFTSSDNATFTVGVPGTFTVTTTGTPTISLLLSFGSFPADVQFVDNGDGTATISGTPQAGTDGPYPVSFQACNTVDCTTADFTLTVNPAGSPPPTCTAPPTGMIAWYPGDGNANDLIGVNDGTLEGGATFASGEVGQGFSLNGTSDYVEIPNSPSISITGAITIDAWIQPTVVTGQGRTIVSKYDSTGQVSYVFFIDTDGNLAFLLSSGNDFREVKTSTPLTANVFSHVAATFDPATQDTKIYVNGQDTNAALSANSSLPGINDTTTPVRIGTYKQGASLIAFFEGIIDEVELFNRALSQSEIQAISDAGSAGKCKCEIPLKVPGTLVSFTTGSNDGYSIGRGVVFQANAALSIAGAGLWTNPQGNTTITVNLWETTSYPSNNVNNTLLATGTRTLQDRGLGYYDVGFTTPVVLEVGHKYHIEVVYDNPGEENFYYSFDQGDVSLGAVDVLDGTEGGNTANTVMPLIRLFTCDAPPTEFKLLNISGRALVGTGDNVAIGGFIIDQDSAATAKGIPHGVNASKRVIIRGIGPSLAAYNVSGPLADPVLDLYDDNGVIIASNDDWRVPSQNETDVNATGLAPSDDHESAIVATLDAGASYTAILRGKNDTTGVGLIEVYDLGSADGAHLENISTRAFVSTGDDVLIGGIIIGNGETGQVLFRAIGPSLANFNVNNPLQDPQLDLFDGQGNHIAHNDNWKEEPDGTPNAGREATINATGFAPSNDNEAAILLLPLPGNYTAIESGVGGTTGVGLVEAYRLGPATP